MNELIIGTILLGVVVTCSVAIGLLVWIQLRQTSIPHPVFGVISYFLIGSLVLSWISFIMRILSIPVIWLFACVLIAGVYLLTFIRKRTMKLLKHLKPGREIVVVGLCLFVLYVLLSLKTTMVSDGLFWWAFKAKLLYQQQYPLTRYFSEPSYLWSHQDYPMYFPTIQYWMYTLYGRLSEPITFNIIPWYLTLTGLWIFGFVRRYHGFFASMVCLVIFLFIPKIQEISVLHYADVIVGLFYVVAVTTYFLFLENPAHKSYAYISFLIGSGLFWIKKEGVILFALYLFLSFIFAGKGISRKTVGLWGLIIALPNIFWYCFLQKIGAKGVDFGVIFHSDRIWEILAYVRRLVKYAPYWGYFWLLFGIVLVVTARRLREKPYAYVTLAVCLPMAVYPLLFLFSSWEPYTEHMRTSLDRLWMQMIPVACVVLFYAVSDASKKHS